MVRFQTKNPVLGKFWSALDWKMLIHFVTNWNILPRFGECYGHLVHFVSIWYIFHVFGIMYIPGKIWQPWMAFVGSDERKWRTNHISFQGLCALQVDYYLNKSLLEKNCSDAFN
jgi:hypothetical protein